MEVRKKMKRKRKKRIHLKTTEKLLKFEGF